MWVLTSFYRINVKLLSLRLWFSDSLFCLYVPMSNQCGQLDTSIWVVIVIMFNKSADLDTWEHIVNYPSRSNIASEDIAQIIWCQWKWCHEITHNGTSFFPPVIFSILLSYASPFFAVTGHLTKSMELRLLGIVWRSMMFCSLRKVSRSYILKFIFSRHWNMKISLSYMIHGWMIRRKQWIWSLSSSHLAIWGSKLPCHLSRRFLFLSSKWCDCSIVDCLPCICLQLYYLWWIDTERSTKM